jgi:hypothetical protein
MMSAGWRCRAVLQTHMRQWNSTMPPIARKVGRNCIVVFADGTKRRRYE